jgi:hypothetical protein
VDDILLIITNSYDTTTDVLLDRLATVPVFRLNFDQITRYKLRFDQDGFHISDPTGRMAGNMTISKAYWRKPFSSDADGSEFWTKYVDAEMRVILTEIVNLLWVEQKLVLVEPFAERRTGKLLQLRHAHGLFAVPAYEVVLNEASRTKPAVVKSLSNELVGDRVLYTTEVRADDLDLRYPWFVEQYIEASHDVTVVFVRRQLFAFSLDRDFLNTTVDWRQCMFQEQKWTRHSLPSDLSTAILEYMEALKLDFGRFDFLLDKHQRYWFCELNPNGQFAWLDLSGEQGLLDAVMQEISPTTERHPIPNRHPLESTCGCPGAQLG